MKLSLGRQCCFGGRKVEFWLSENRVELFRVYCQGWQGDLLSALYNKMEIYCAGGTLPSPLHAAAGLTGPLHTYQPWLRNPPQNYVFHQSFFQPRFGIILSVRSLNDIHYWLAAVEWEDCKLGYCPVRAAAAAGETKRVVSNISFVQFRENFESRFHRR